MLHFHLKRNLNIYVFINQCIMRLSLYMKILLYLCYRRIKTIYFLMIYGTMKVCKYIRISVTYLPVQCYAHRFHVSKNALNQVLGELPGLFGSQYMFSVYYTGKGFQRENGHNKCSYSHKPWKHFGANMMYSAA